MVGDSKESKQSVLKITQTTVKNALVWLPVMLIKCYQYLISPLLGQRCRFYPSCSHYAQEAFLQFGLLKGGKLTIFRLAKCHPWHTGGIDLVPDHSDESPVNNK